MFLPPHQSFSAHYSPGWSSARKRCKIIYLRHKDPIPSTYMQQFYWFSANIDTLQLKEFCNILSSANFRFKSHFNIWVGWQSIKIWQCVHFGRVFCKILSSVNSIWVLLWHLDHMTNFRLNTAECFLFPGLVDTLKGWTEVHRNIHISWWIHLESNQVENSFCLVIEQNINVALNFKKLKF